MADIGALIGYGLAANNKQEMRDSVISTSEMDQDSISFYARRNRFVQFLLIHTMTSLENMRCITVTWELPPAKYML